MRDELSNDIDDFHNECKRPLLQPIEVIAVPVGFQPVQQMLQVRARVGVVESAALDDRVHEGVVRRGTLATDVAHIAQVHLELAHRLLRDALRYLHVAAA